MKRIFYRIYSFLKRTKKNGDDSAFLAVCFLTVLTFLNLYSIILIANKLNIVHCDFKSAEEIIAVILVVLFSYYVLYGRKRRYLKIEADLEGEKMSPVSIGLIAWFLISFILPFVI